MSRSFAIVAALAAAFACTPNARDSGTEPARPSPLIVSTTVFTPVYVDALAPGWADWSWATRNLANPAPVASGTASIAATFAPWTGLNLANTSAGVPAAGLTWLDLWANGGTRAGNTILARLRFPAGLGPYAYLGGYCDGGSIPAGAFVRCQVPLTALGATDASTIQAVILQEGAGLTLPAMYFDQIGFSALGTPPPSPPTAPTGLAGTAVPGSVSLSWNAVTGATGYFVYRGGAKLFVAPISVTQYTDATATAGATFAYSVSATNAAGEGPQSAPVTISVPLPTPPATPTGLGATASPGAVVLSWTASAGAAAYSIYRSAASAGPYARLTAQPIAATSYTDLAVTSGSSYFYEVTASNAAGESAPTAPVQATVPPPPAGAFSFHEPFLWSGNHAATLAAGGTTVWWNADAWDVRGDVAYNASAYLTTMVGKEAGFHVDIHKAANTNPTSAALDNTAYVVGGDGSRGLATMRLDFEDILSARLRNPIAISAAEPAVITFRAPRFVTTGHWWEIALTPADRVTAGEWTSVPAASAGLAGPFGTGFAINTTNGVGNGHRPPEDSLNFVFQGYPDVPCSAGWHVHPEVKATFGGVTYDVWTPVIDVSQLPPTDPSEIMVLYNYRLEYRPGSVDFYADWDVPGALTLRGHYPITIPWSSAHVQLLGVAYQADHHPQIPCFQGEVREIHWGDFTAAPLQFARTSVAPRDAVTTNVSRATGWEAYDLRDIQRFGPPGADGLLQPNALAYDRYGSMLYASFRVWASAISPAPVQSVDLTVNVTPDQVAAAHAQVLADVRYTGTANVSINGTPIGSLPLASTVPAALAEDGGLASIWVRRALPFSPALLVAGANRVHLDLVGSVALDRLQLEFLHAQ